MHFNYRKFLYICKINYLQLKNKQETEKLTKLQSLPQAKMEQINKPKNYEYKIYSSDDKRR